MRSPLFRTLLVFAVPCAAQAVSLLQPNDFIIGIDEIPTASASLSTPGEGVNNIFDGSLATKYFNYGGSGSGFIATLPSASPMGSFVVSTANDSPVRDPASYQIWGTNDPVNSGYNSGGQGENWTLVSSGSLSLSDVRNLNSSVIATGSNASFTSWKIVFPTTKAASANFFNDDTYFQISGFQGYSQSNGQGPLFSTTTPVIPIDSPVIYSSSPCGQRAGSLLDDDYDTKYLNFGKEGSGFIVTPTYGASILNSFYLSTASDAGSYSSRNPTSYAIYGTNQSIISPENSAGNLEAWTLIASGSITLPSGGYNDTGYISVSNSTAYTSYKMVFPTIIGGTGFFDNSMQISGVYFDGILVPEASTASLGMVAATGLALRRRRRES